MITPPMRPSAPSRARITDYLLGSTHNLGIDRAVIDVLLQCLPARHRPAVLAGLRRHARAMRMFLARATHACITEHRLTQVIDLGTMIPATPGTHALARALDPTTRVAYVVDNSHDMAVAHRLLAGTDHIVVASSGFKPLATWSLLTGDGGLDPQRPVVLLAVDVLDQLRTAEQVRDVLADWRTCLPVGSVLVISHLTDDRLPAADAATAAGMRTVYRDRVRKTLTARSHEEVTGLLAAAGIRLSTPLVMAHHWRPIDPDAPDTRSWVGIATVGEA
ncbi:SAM-dependent methyltransferase [Umezawaea sp. Da 62-37]|uniref:SAM-dependent methyltransferase n=1 Tax=Umezawaea sp. Da 62-37 TaxID=3075927 RepID=UPI0028F71E75|nr:SAM-dependent methyltransferase [Umezawaea sp. Da 62-37]WNV85022.1 SAM-dependent methyltransferase [Umezawaea sp. Da 62-37]